MGCADCKDHSSVQTMIELHEKRLDANNEEHRQIKEAMKLKISRWVFIWIVGFIFTGMMWQVNTLHQVSNQVAVLYDRQITKDNAESKPDKKETSLTSTPKPSRTRMANLSINR